MVNILKKINKNMALVYRHRRLDKNEIFYIGISNDRKNNKRRPYRKDGRNNSWNKIVSETNYEVEIIADNIDIETAEELEIFLIELYGRIDLNTGTLCNLTSGGLINNDMGIESRKKISEAITKRNLGSKQSIEHIQKRIKANIGIKKSEDTIKKMKQSAIKSGQSRKTILIDYKTGEELGIFDSLSDACRFANLEPKKYTSKASVIANCKGRNHVNGFSFKYIEYYKDKLKD